MTVPPHGGQLVDLYLDGEALLEEKVKAAEHPAWTLNERQLSDIEQLLSGGFSPLTGYLGEEDYNAVLETMQLTSGLLWPLPLTLDVTEEFAETLSCGETIGLYDPEGLLIATLDISAIWRPDRQHEAAITLGSTDKTHPGVSLLLDQHHPICLGGKLHGISAPPRYAFARYRRNPAQLREEFRRCSWNRTLAYHAHSPMFGAQIAVASRFARENQANLIIQATLETGRKCLVDDFTRMRCYELAMRQLPEQTTMLSAISLSTRHAGPREALWHAIIRQNYGFSHILIGPDHGSPNREQRYRSDAAKQLIDRYRDELAIEPILIDEMRYVPQRADFLPPSEITNNQAVLDLPLDELERRLENDLEIPTWFASRDIIGEIRRARPPRHRQGFALFFTGLSGSGKSTLAQAMMSKLRELGDRSVSLLDGDIVRRHLSSELGFSREHRDLNITRIGFVAAEITHAGGVAICAPIAPYRQTRRKVREMISAVGGFIEVHVATPLEVCEARDRKGLYAKARKGIIKEFTGISDPYEVPENAEIVIDTSGISATEAANQIMLRLEQLGYIR